jgi:hypothetical protein
VLILKLIFVAKSFYFSHSMPSFKSSYDLLNPSDAIFTMTISAKHVQFITEDHLQKRTNISTIYNQLKNRNFWRKWFKMRSTKAWVEGSGILQWKGEEQRFGCNIGEMLLKIRECFVISLIWCIFFYIFIVTVKPTFSRLFAIKTQVHHFIH